MSSITTIELLDQSFVSSSSEERSNAVGAVFSNKVNTSGATMSLLTEFGDTADISAGYVLVETVSEWVNRYTAKYAGISGADAVRSPDPTNTETMCTGPNSINCFAGANGNLARQWWSVHNFLQYGGICVVAGDAGNWSTTNNPVTDKSKFADIDVVFALDSGITQSNIVSNIVGSRGNDCFGVVGASGNVSGYGEPINGVGGQTALGVVPRGLSMGQYGMCIFGEKEHFGLEDENLTIVSTPLMADAAGCLVRTDRDYYPWYSPAGYVRGRILNIIRLKDQPSKATQAYFGANKINYAITVSGQGTFLFSDRTLINDNNSSYKYISVSRLLIHLIKNISPIANRFLFELNSDSTRTTFINSVTPLLDGVVSTGGLQDYTIICDESNNPPSVVAENKFVVDLTIKPYKSIYTILLRFTNLNI